jgi:hypothetical protein
VTSTHDPGSQPLEWLAAEEARCATELRRVSLAAEFVVEPQERNEALGLLGAYYEKYYVDPVRRTKVLRMWPALHVLASTGVATDHYENGTFWPKLTNLIGVTNDQTFQVEWGQAYLDNLRTLGLPLFDRESDDAGTRYVGRILMHCGMPTYCLPDLFRLIGRMRAQRAGLSPGDFVGWAAGQASKKQLQLDMPVRRFLQYGGDFATDVVDRCFDLLDVVAAGRDGSDVPLPQRFKDVALSMRDEVREVGRERHGSTFTRSEPARAPYLLVDPFGLGVVMRLPAIGEVPDGRAVWHVLLDGAAQRIPTRPLVPGSDEPAPPTDVPIIQPLRTASAALVGREDLVTNVPVVDDADPILFFAEDGRQLPGGLPLPAAPTWVLYPMEREELSTVVDAPVLTESPLPPGWSGWCLELRDLQSVSSVGLVGARTHSVRSQAVARIALAPPVVGLRTSLGLPVHGTLPAIVLPAELVDATWEVTVHDVDGALVGRWSSQTSDDPSDVWNAAPRPLVGSYDVRVRGPWGRGASRSVTVVEGLRANFAPGWRPFAERGLVASAATLSAADGVSLARTSVAFGAHEQHSYVRAGAHGRFLSMVVTPPHMTVSHVTDGGASTPSIVAVKMYAEDLAAGSTLVVDIGREAEPQLHYVTSGGSLQDIAPAAGRQGVYRFDLSKLADTVARHPQGRLALSSDGQVAVGVVQPRRLFSEAAVDGATITFSECVDVTDLTALVYSTRAPWRSPEVVTIEGGTATLPEWLVDSGPLRILVRLDDPWAPAPVPAWPETRSSTSVVAEGYVSDPDDAEATALSMFLAGSRPDLPDISDFARLWTVRGLMSSLYLERHWEVAEAIDEVLHRHPRQALLALDSSRVPTGLIPSLLVQARLLWTDLSSAHDDEPPPWSARSAITATLLCAADGDWSTDEVAAAVDVCGDALTELLEGRDPYAAAGRLTESAEVFKAAPPAMREEFIRQIGLVPTGLLSADARRMASIDLVQRLEDPRLEWLLRNSHVVVDEAERLSRIIGDEVAAAAIQARRHQKGKGWFQIPAASLGLAFAARHAARGNDVARQWLERRSRTWADLAGAAPQMVTIDLICAELLVSSSTTKEHLH